MTVGVLKVIDLSRDEMCTVGCGVVAGTVMARHWYGCMAVRWWYGGTVARWYGESRACVWSGSAGIRGDFSEAVQIGA